MKAILAGLMIATLILMIQDGAAAPNPQPVSTNNEDFVAIHAPANTNDLPEMFCTGTTNLDQLLQVYAGLAGKTVLRPAKWTAIAVTLKCNEPITHHETLEAVGRMLELTDIALVDSGNGVMKAVRADLSRTRAAWENTEPRVTHISKVLWCKPSELVPALTPFASVPNGILPLDSEQLLVLRDRPENVKRMLDLLAMVDQRPPREFISEIIQVKYAKASDVVGALNSLNSGGDGNKDALERLLRRATTSDDLPVVGRIKMVADERSNSILIFATRSDMDTIKHLLPKLDQAF